MGSAQAQGEMWGARARDWSEIAEPVSRPAWEALFAKAGVGPRTRLLDVGCGSGGALVMARSMGAEVSGIDASAALAEIARERLPEARIEVGDMEALPFEDNSFDVVTGFNSFQFADDTVSAFREAGRVCKPGGKVGVVVWGRREDCETMRATMSAVMALMPPPPEPPGPSISDPGVLEGKLEEAGLAPVLDGDVEIPFVFRDAETACRGMMSAGIIVRAAQVAGEERVREAILDSFGPYTRPDGSVLQINRFRWMIATSA